MIDKKKLIEMFLKVKVGAGVVKIVENFAEESEIDFDALYKELLKDCGDSCEKEESCKACTFDFLKSKHLTAPKKFEIQTKKTWTLKPEFERYSRSINHVPTTLHVQPIKDPNPEFYDLHEEPDYSNIPVGAYIVVKFKEFNRSKCGVVCQHYRDFFNIDTGDNQHSVSYNGDGVESIEILKMAEVK